MWFVDHVPTVSDHQESQMLRNRATRWVVRLGAVATTVAVGVLVFTSAAQADVIWGFVGQ
jgi:hypothetical protein